MRTFKIGSNEFVYEQQMLPCRKERHIGERTVEVPIGRWYLRLYPDEVKTIEVGAVMPYRIDKVLHEVVDPFDPWPGCVKSDAVGYDYRGATVLSISTLEHVGRIEYAETRDDPSLACKAFHQIASQSRHFLITIPLGWHKILDHYIRGYECCKSMLRQTSPLNEWRWEPEVDWSCQYDTPYPYANGLLLAADHETRNFLWR